MWYLQGTHFDRWFQPLRKADVEKKKLGNGHSDIKRQGVVLLKWFSSFFSTKQYLKIL